MLHTCKSKPRRIGIVYPEINGWTGGSKFIRILIHSLGNACETADTELYVLSERNELRHSGLPTERVIRVGAPSYFRGESRLRQLLALPDKSALFNAAREHRISVVLPVRTAPFRSSGLKTIGWIPDFQHVYLPELFSEGTRAYRDYTYRQLADHSTLVMLSSRTALEDFAAFAPKHAHKGRVVSFPSLFAFEHLQDNVFETQQKFRIPAKFALVANQFWRHKNHELVIEAVRQLRHGGIRVPVVITGVPVDSRDPNNETTSRILQAVVSAGLLEEVVVLGMVSDGDLANLMRTAAIVIQPSRFEGWSSVVQECKAFGRPLICSDIPTHREQAPEALGFFPCDRPDKLADLLAVNWPTLEPGPNLMVENAALTAEREFARQHGESLLRICQEAESG